MPDITRSNDYRAVYANTFQVTMTPTEVQIVCGIQTNPGEEDPEMEAQVAVITTHAGAKLLEQLFVLLLAEHEAMTGLPIAFDSSKLNTLREIIAKNRAIREAQTPKT